MKHVPLHFPILLACLLRLPKLSSSFHNIKTPQALNSITASSPLYALQHDATLSDKSFSELYHDNLPEWLLEKCEENGFKSPTLIQERALNCFFNDDANSIVIQAQTGSGKTLTYLLPLLARLEDRAAVQAMIVVPTRELGLQVARIAKRLAARRFMVMSLLQGSQLRRQRAWAWAETPHVVIGTPVELLDMVQYGGLPRINSIEYVVVDEVDACLVHKSGTTLSNVDKTLSSSLHQLLSKFLSPTYAEEEDDNALPDDSKTKPKRRLSHRQTVFASATIPQHRHFLKQCKANQWTLEEPVFVCTSPGEALPPTLSHGYMICQTKEKKLATLRRVIQKMQSSSHKILVFCDSNRPMEEMGAALAHDVKGVYYQDGRTDLEEQKSKPIASVLRFEDSLTQRAGATKSFSDSSEFRVMLTNDLAARGLDIPGITHVVHFDLPIDSDTYLHRSGRAGRLGKRGQVLSVLTPDQEFVLMRLSNALNLDLKCVGRQKAKNKA
jgi:superfamily II DNA/RNA helicase